MYYFIANRPKAPCFTLLVFPLRRHLRLCCYIGGTRTLLSRYILPSRSSCKLSCGASPTLPELPNCISTTSLCLNPIIKIALGPGRTMQRILRGHLFLKWENSPRPNRFPCTPPSSEFSEKVLKDDLAWKRFEEKVKKMHYSPFCSID